MNFTKELTACNIYIGKPSSVSRKTHRLQELYRFLDFYCPENQRNYVVNKELWKKFVGWNKGHFWASEKNIKRNFSFSAMEYLKNRILARRLLDTSTNAERSSNSARIQTEKRRMTKNRVSTRTIQKLTKQAFEG